MRNEEERESYVVKMKGKIIWSPSALEEEEDLLSLKGLNTRKSVVFPELHFATQNGIEENDLVNHLNRKMKYASFR